MKIIKRNSSEENFNGEKIVNAVTKANNASEKKYLTNEQISEIADYVEYKCSNYEEVYAAALSDAVRKAKSKAEVIAEAAEGTLGSIVSITENYENTYYRRSESYDTGALKNMAAAEDTIELSPQEAEIQAGVTIEYRLE